MTDYMANPPGLNFIDARTGRQMKYVYPDSKHWARGWLLYLGTEGQWVTWRRATQEDLMVLNKAIVCAHHGFAE